MDVVWSAIAYLGEVDPGLSSQSLGITNAQDLLQVSPTDTDLVQALSLGGLPHELEESAV